MTAAPHPDRRMAWSATSRLPAPWISKYSMARFRPDAAASETRRSAPSPGCWEFATIATRSIFGSTVLSSSMRLPTISKARNDTPVRSPSGRAKVWTNPAATGSPLNANTTGIPPASRRAAYAVGPWATITCGRRAMAAAARISLPAAVLSPHHASSSRLEPSTWPRVRRPDRNASRNRTPSRAGPGDSHATRYGSRCATAGHAAASNADPIPASARRLGVVTHRPPRALAAQWVRASKHGRLCP